MKQLLPWGCRAFLCLEFLMVCAGGSPAGVWAQEAVSLRAQVIYAANEPGGVDARLGSLAGELQRTFRYSMYQLLEAPQGPAALNKPWRVDLPGDRTLEVIPTAIQGGQYSLTVHVLGPGGQVLVNTQVRLRGGGPPVSVGGLPHQKGVLIIAISAG